MADRNKAVAALARLLGEVHSVPVARKRTEWGESFRARVNGELAPALEHFDARAALVDADKGLTAVGKARALNALRKETRARVEAFRKDTVGTIRGQVTEREASLSHRAGFQPSADPAERQAQETRAAELRAQVRGLDPFQRDSLYLTAEAAGDAFTTWALESGPLVVNVRDKRDARAPGQPYLAPMVEPERVTQFRLARVERDHPEEVEELRGLQAVASAYEAVIGSSLDAVGKDEPEGEEPAPTPEPALTGDPAKDVLIKAGMVPGPDAAVARE